MPTSQRFFEDTSPDGSPQWWAFTWDVVTEGVIPSGSTLLVNQRRSGPFRTYAEAFKACGPETDFRGLPLPSARERVA